MKITRVWRAGGVGASVLLAAGIVYAGQGSAAAVPEAAPEAASETGASAPAAAAKRDPAEVASAAAARLGSRSAGGYVDRQGRPVVTVTRAEDAAAVRSLGATPKTVTRSGAMLAKVSDRLHRAVRTPGTSWSVDPVTAQVVVQADRTVTGSRLTAVRKAVKGQGNAARLEQVKGKMAPLIAGGDPIYGGGYRCSLGFNVRRGSTYYFLTAGHCTNEAVNWYLGNNATLGTRAGTSFPYNDYGIVRHTNRNLVKTGGINLYNGSFRDLTGAGTPVVGTTVYRSGSTTGLHSGTVLGLNATVNYEEGSVYGMIRTSVCAEPGDSGGPLFRGAAGLGLTSGGWGDCTDGGEVYFQPVIEAMQRYHVVIY